MDQKRLNELVAALTAKGVNRPCPRCEKSKFSIVGETIIPIQDDPKVFAVGGPSIPAVIVACDSCGYITHHATMVLAPLGPGGK